MERFDSPDEEEQELTQAKQTRVESQPIVHVHIPKEVEIKFSQPVILGFQIGFGLLVMVLAAGFILLLTILMLDIAI